MEQEKKKTNRKIILPLIVVIILIIGVITLTNRTEKETLKTSKYFEIKGIYVDKSDEEKYPNESLIYVLYTVKSDDKNIRFYTYMASNPGTALTININNINEYKDTIYSGKLKQNFRDTGYENLNNGQEVLAGTSMECIGAFRVAKNDLNPGGTIQLTLVGTNSFKEVLEYKTDDVLYFNNAKEILKNADYETYEKVEKLNAEKLADIDTNLKKKINKALHENYYYWYISTIRMQIEFEGNKFKVTGAGMSNSGTYEIKNKVILLHYNTGVTNQFPYEFKNGEVNFTDIPE